MYSHNNCFVLDFKPAAKVDLAIKMVQGMLVEFIVKALIDPKGKFYGGPKDAA